MITGMNIMMFGTLQHMGRNKKNRKGETSDPKEFLAQDDIPRCCNVKCNVEFIEFEQ